MRSIAEIREDIERCEAEPSSGAKAIERRLLEKELSDALVDAYYAGKYVVLPCKPIDETGRWSHGKFIMEYHFDKAQIEAALAAQEGEGK